MSSQPSDHAAWRLPTDPSQPPLNVNTFHSTLSPALAPPPYASRVGSQNAASSSQTHPVQQTSRKRQFRFSVRADIDLLKLVIKLNPYGAPHGGRLHKWHAIADTLKDSGIDIDFRRARDRTGLLLDQWREQDLSLLRRSGSGNQEDQAQKERLLARISEIEQAARPRDSSADWRNRDPAARFRNSQPAHASPSQLSVGLTDNVSAQAALNVIASGDPRPNKFGNFSAGLHAPGHLPPLMQKQDGHGLTQTRIDSELQSIRFAQPHPTHPAEKRFKTTQGPSLSPRFAQPIFDNPPSPPKPIPLHASSTERRSPQRSDPCTYRPELSLLRNPSQPVHRAPNLSILGSTQLDVGAANVVSSSPRIGDSQNIQLDPVSTGIQRQAPAADVDQLRAQIIRLERRLDEEITFSRKRLEYDERRLVWEKDREKKKLEVEKERIAREFEDRKADREERRRREQADREDRERLMKIIMRSQGQDVNSGGNAN